MHVLPTLLSHHSPLPDASCRRVEGPQRVSSSSATPLNGRQGRLLGRSAAVMQTCSLNAMLCHAGFLFIKAINAANKDAERQDKVDGY